MPSGEPTATPVPTFDFGGAFQGVSDQLVTQADLTRLAIFALVLMVGIVAAAAVGLLVAEVRGRG